MNDSIKRMSLDIHKPSSNETVNVKRGDTARKLYISLVDGGIPYIISEECYAVFTAKKPDGNVVYNNCSIENNTIIYEVTEQTVAVEGRVNCEIKLYGAYDKLITSSKFTILVYGTVYNEGDEIESSDEFNALTKLIGEAQKATDEANEAAQNAAKTAKSLMVVGKTEGSNISLDDAIDQYLVGCRIFGKTTQNGTPTPENPVELVSVGDGGSVSVFVSGKNLLDVPEVISFTKAHQKNVFIPKGTYVVSCDVATSGGDNNPTIGLFDADDARLATVQLTANKPVTVTFRNDIVRIYIYSNGWSDSGSAGISATIEHLMISKDGGNYEAYKEQTMVINTIGLSGIPVTSGGNYTDSNGQQWICDEIDFARGVYVQRVACVSFDGSSEEIWMINIAGNLYQFYTSGTKNARNSSTVLCSSFQSKNLLSEENNSFVGSTGRFSCFTASISTVDEWKAYLAENPMSVIYILATPIETPLSAEELAAYATLHTYRNNTTVFNDAGAYMELEYVMDAKKYIDSLIAGIGGSTATILNATVE